MVGFDGNLKILSEIEEQKKPADFVLNLLRGYKAAGITGIKKFYRKIA
jgi:hypothetical protein